MPISLEYVRGALDYKTSREIRVAFPARKTIFQSEDRKEIAPQSLEEWVGEFARLREAIPPYMQILGIDGSRPGFVTIAQPDGHKLRRILGGIGVFGTFSLEDLTLLDDED